MGLLIDKRKVRNYNILSLDGGGMKGLILLTQLVKLEEMLGKPLYKHFNMISGTSTGGIVAALLSIGISAKDILDVYTHHGKSIFKKEFLRFGFLRPKYNDKYYNKLIKYYVGDIRLADIKNNVLLLVGYNATTNTRKLFKSKLAKKNEDENYTLYDAIRVTSSAPTYFKPHQIEGDDSYYIDGGLVINNPALASYLYAKNIINEFSQKINHHINILSFSTGNIDKPIKPVVIKGGKINWALKSVKILLSEQAETTDYNLDGIYKYNPGVYKRCLSTIKYSSGVIDDASQKNVLNMIKDGELSIENNLHKIQEFIKKTTI